MNISRKLNSDLPEESLTQLSERILDRTGLYYPNERLQDLSNGVDALARSLKIKPADCLDQLLHAVNQFHWLDQLTYLLSIKETHFYRDPKLFAVLEEKILPNLINRKRGQRVLNIWSAGCCTGEEAYSLSIALQRTLPEIDTWQVRILGTDINPHYLDIARMGAYKAWSFRESPNWLKFYFLEENNGIFSVIPDVKSRVEFFKHNLRDLDIFPNVSGFLYFDLIMCRNVFIYFEQEKIRRCIARFHSLLEEGGFFIVGASEASMTHLSEFQQFLPDMVTIHQKTKEKKLPTPIMDYIPQLLEDNSLDLSFHPPPLDTTRDPLEELKNLYHDKKYELAREMAHKCLTGKDRITPRLYLARIEANQRNAEEAIRWAKEAVAQDNLNSHAHYIYGLILAEENKIAEAIVELEKSLFADKDFILAHFILGSLQLKEAKIHKARRSFRNAFQLLKKLHPDEVLPSFERMSVKQLQDLTQSMLSKLTETV